MNEINLIPVLVDNYVKDRIVDLMLFYSEAVTKSESEFLDSYKKEFAQRLDELFCLRDNFNK